LKPILFFFGAYLLCAFIHEGTHALVALLFDEYQVFHLVPLGFEVVYKTPVEMRDGISWGWIAGMSNLLTLMIGYVLFLIRKQLKSSGIKWLRWIYFYSVIVFMLSDPFNLSLGPFIYGGDIGGIEVGFGIHRYVIQAVFFIVLLVNRELIIRIFLPENNVHTKHILLQPLNLFKKRKDKKS